MTTLTPAESEAIQQQVLEQFQQLVADINRVDAAAWAAHYSQTGFLSAVAGTDMYATRQAWVDAISSYFAAREKQHVEILATHVIPLAPDTALLTSQEISEMVLKTGQTSRVKHVFTMVWKKENGAWKIVHSHESWGDE